MNCLEKSIINTFTLRGFHNTHMPFENLIEYVLTEALKLVLMILLTTFSPLALGSRIANISISYFLFKSLMRLNNDF